MVAWLKKYSKLVPSVVVAAGAVASLPWAHGAVLNVALTVSTVGAAVGAATWAAPANQGGPVGPR